MKCDFNGGEIMYIAYACKSCIEYLIFSYIGIYYDGGIFLYYKYKKYFILFEKKKKKKH